MKTKNIYSLPFKGNILTLPVSDKRVHSKKFNNEHSIDFLIGPNTEILSSAKGIITDIKVDSTLGGPDIKFAETKYQNYITISHKNGESSQYIHLAPNSALVKKGEKVKQGQAIARGIGMIGFTTVPHLHFEVFRNKDEKSLDIMWATKPPKIYHCPNEVFNEIKKPKYESLLKTINKEQSKFN
ncbi:MAG: M23 family metallopeptidase [Candidatus Pacearchaeota archaeon]|jgi:murein DD-endopeptidase MepM/ murein hydrolase activator NlpD